MINKMLFVCLYVFEKQTLDGGSKLRMTTANTHTHMMLVAKNRKYWV